ncbi:RNA polymerase sigma factor [Parapedobacter deserti]|uniref:RNA polymerase sigma factor n=1 Tax=Parapedobacter deserti TaxID=1912957 RepID=A0ABV7JRT5_9SPHI
MIRDEAIDTISQYWKQVINGDDRAFRALYDHCIDKLYHWGSVCCNDPEVVKDSIQELFVDLYTYRRKLRPETDVYAYLYVSLRRKLNKQRKKVRALRAMDEHLLTIDAEEDIERQTVRREEYDQRLALLRKEVVELPSRQREVLFLRYTSGLSYDAVSKIMKIPIPTCRTLLSRALRQLRQRIKPA